MTTVTRGCSRRTFLGLLAGAAMAAAGRAPAAAGEAAAERKACALIRRAIPKTKETLPAVGLGTWNGLSRESYETSRAVLARFVALGGVLVDTAPMYGDAEQAIGDIVRELDVRDRLFLATKVLSTGREAGRAQMRRSFEYLDVARLDLMQIHNLADWRTQLRTLHELRAGGTIRYAGVTHYRVDAHPELERVVAEEDVDFVQLNYNIAVRDAEKQLLPRAAERGVAVIVNRPFEEGALFARVRGVELPGWAREIGCATFGQVFLKFILSHPAVTCAIPGTDRIDHVEDNLGAACGALPDPALRRRMVEWFDAL
jgi:aryl-alcohol dehydrogenase-like predicted oxidoreductase